MRCSRAMGAVDRGLSERFRRLGRRIGTHPSFFVVVPVLLSALAATGVQQLHYQDDPSYLFSPETGRAKQELAVVSRLFPDNYTAFSPARMIDVGKFMRLLVTAADGGDLLRAAAFDELVELDRLVRDVEVDAGNERFRYDELCASWHDECLENVATRLQPYMRDVERGAVNLTYPVWLSKNFDVFLLPEAMGSPLLADGQVVAAPAVQMWYWAGNQAYFNVSLSLRWEEAVQAVLAGAQHRFRHINVSRFGSQTLRTELDNNTVSVAPYMTAMAVVMVVFCMGATMMADWVRAKPLLGLLGVVSASMATGTAFGLLMYCQVEFIGINLAAPFLMLGIGMDDSFVMLAAWRRTRIQDPVPERLSQTYQEAAVSITITSLTNVISFMVGAISPFPSVRIFCIYTGVSVVMTYLWHVLFFGGCMAVCGYAEQKNLHALTHRPVLPVSESDGRSRVYRLFCSGGISKSDPWNEKDNGEHAITAFFRDRVAGALNLPAVKALVITVFLAYLGVAVWGCTMVREGLDKRRLSRDDSYSIQTYEVEDKYFRDHPYRVQVIIEGEYDYSDPTVQDKLEHLLQTFENSTYVENKMYTESWLRELLLVQDMFVGMDIYDVSTYDAWIDTVKQFIGDSLGPYSRDVVFDGTGQKVVACRFIIQTKNIFTSQDDKDMMLALRSICDNSELRCTIFHPLFTFFDQFVLVRSISIQSICISAFIMCIVALIFIPSPSCSLWVAFSIVSIETGVVGYMTLWDVNLDCISMINLIMCIGFSVDFSAHISYAYLSARGLSPADRVRRSLHELGLPIVQGGMSTVLGVAALYLAPSYIYVTFFKTNFLVIVFGMLHGVFLLPVLLSLLGPGSRCCSGREAKPPAAQPPAVLSATNLLLVVDAGPNGALPLKIPRPHIGAAKQSAEPASGDAPRVRSVTVTTGDDSASSRDAGIGTSAGGSSSGDSSSSSSSSSSVVGRDSGGGSKADTARTPVSVRHGRPPLPPPSYDNTGYVGDDEASRRRPTRLTPLRDRATLSPNVAE